MDPGTFNRWLDRIEEAFRIAAEHVDGWIARSRPALLRLGLWLRGFIAPVLRSILLILAPGRPLSTRLRMASTGFVGVVCVLLALVTAYVIVLVPLTPGFGTLQKSRVEVPSVVMSVDGQVITRYHRVNREWVPLEGVSEHVIQALLATEDHRFYRHFGVDLVRVAGGLWATLRGSRQGGSTITQQLARNMFPDEIGRAISLRRKLKEAVTALKIELAYDKDGILEAYLNTVPFYFGAYGIEMASRTYFGKSAAELDVLESATLIGMLKGTYLYNPVRNPERALERRNVALRQMVRFGYLEQEEYEQMKEGPIRLRFERQPEPGSRAPHFTEHVRMQMIEWADRHGYNIYRDSLVIHTTLDMRLQEAAENAVRRQGDALQAVVDVEWGRPSVSLLSRNASNYLSYRRNVSAFEQFWASRSNLLPSFVRGTPEFRRGVESGVPADVMLESLLGDAAFVDSLKKEKTRLETGFVAIEPHTGHVRAWVGSRGFERDQYDHVARARRQPGSTFKPFVYARALEEGFRPGDMLVDQEVEILLDNGFTWSPRNAGEMVTGREMTLTDGLAYSKNTITAQLVELVGARDVASLARRMGINRSELRPVPSLALGTSEVSLMEMVSAYGTLANAGVHREPVIVTRIEDRQGRVLARFDARPRRVASEHSALAVVDMLRDAVDRGTATRIRSTFGINADVAGKTGTTQNNADGWFILMHPRLVAGSWVGFNDPRVTFRSDYWGQGGNNALLIVGDFFQGAMQTIEERDATFPPPPAFDEKPSRIVQVAHWVRDLLTSAWGLFFGKDGEPEAEPAEYYIAERTSGAVQMSLSGETLADSLTRMHRRQTGLDSLLRQFPTRTEPSDSPNTGQEPSPGLEDDSSPDEAQDSTPDEAQE